MIYKEMRKRLLSIMICLGIMSAHAQSVADMFANLPYDKAEYLTESLRAELLSNYKAGKEAKVTNKLQGESSIDTLSADYGYFHLSDAKDMTLARLPYADGDSLYLCITTVSAPAKQSVVEFYDGKWQRYPSMRFMPDMSTVNLTARPDTMSVETYDKLKSLLSPQLISYDYNPSSMTLNIDVSTPFLTKEELTRVDVILCKRKLKWTSLMFN